MLTVITPSSQRLTTVTAMLNHLGLVEADMEEIDALVLIDQASAIIAKWCHRVLLEESVQEVVRLECYSRCLDLTRFPLGTITSVVEDGTTLTGADYEADSQAGLLYRLRSDERCYWTARKVTVVYDGGYPSASGDLEMACLTLIQSLYSGRGRDPLLRSETTEEVGAMSWLDPRPGMEALPPQVAGYLTDYRLSVFG